MQAIKFRDGALFMSNMRAKCAISELHATIIQCAWQTMVDIIYTHMYIILMWPESKIDAKERVSEVFPAIKL